MQKTPWFREGQADVMLNYLPLRNVLIQGIKAVVKNKALPDFSRLSTPPSDHSLSLSLTLQPTPFILRVFPESCRGWTLAVKYYSVIKMAGRKFVTAWMKPKGIMLSEVNRRKTNTEIISFIWSLKVKFIETEMQKHNFIARGQEMREVGRSW